MKLSYRPEIDGLRAIAVAAVILYHSKISFLNQKIFTGGFIGVDIFFVISGYLITSIILQELKTTKDFSFKNFYERRVRRILPVLLLVILTSIPFALLILMPASLVDFSKSITYSLGFSSNFYFHYSGQIYGAESGLLKPFLHTWSLSVEEQFYILFPLILFFIYKKLNKSIFSFFLITFFLSISIAIWGSKTYPSFYFYALFSRGWEVLAGSLLAYFELKFGRRGKKKIFNFFLPSIGLILILHSFLFFEDSMRHPSLTTLSPIIGVCLIIWFSNQNEIITKILSYKIFVGVGLISYSLYLWHYPIFAFARITGIIEADIIKKILLAVIIFFMSILSYFLIEKPARQRKFNFKKILISIIIFSSVISIFSFYTIYKNGKINKVNKYISKQVSSPLYQSQCKFSSDKSDFLDENFFKIDFVNCKKNLGKFILILGDSHSLDLFNSLAKVSSKNNFIIGLNKGGCRPSKNEDKKCQYYNALDFIINNKDDIKYIFYNQKGSYFLKDYISLPVNLDKINKTFNYLTELKKVTNKLYFIGPHMEQKKNLSRKDIKNILKNKLPLDNTKYDLLKLDEKLAIISKKNEIKYISQIQAINFKFNKDFLVDSNLTYSNGDHWSDYGEIYFGKKLISNSILKGILIQ